MIVYEHTFPVSAIIMSLAAALLLGTFTAWKFMPRNWGNAGVLTLYVLSLLGIGWSLLLPGFKNSVSQLLKPRFIIALDTSRSMTLSPTPDVPSRWSTAQEALKRPWLQALSAECQVEIYPFASEVGENLPLSKVAALKPEGAGTALRDTLKQIADRNAGLNVAGLLLLSDGVDTREALDDWAAAERPFPIHTMRLEPPGGWQQEPDLRIDAVTTSRRVTVG